MGTFPGILSRARAGNNQFHYPSSERTHLTTYVTTYGADGWATSGQNGPGATGFPS